MRDFFFSNKKEIKFVYNFHCAGREFIVPFNSAEPGSPESLKKKLPEINMIFEEIIKESKWAEGTRFGSTAQILGAVVGGSAGDWIVHSLEIPAAEAEIGD